MGSTIKRGILQSFDPTTYTASCLLLEATSAYLTGVPIATSVDSERAIPGALCAVLFFDETNHTDAVIIACYPNGSQGVPSAVAKGLITFVTPYTAQGGFVVNSGTTQTLPLVANPPVPLGVSALLVQVFMTSPTANARFYLAPHNGGGIANYMVLGNLYAANATIFATGILPVDANGEVDVNANGGTITATIIVYGYVS